MKARSANQHVNWRTGYSSLATFVTSTGGFFIVPGGQNDIGEVPQVVAQSAELSVLPEPRKQFLADGSKQLRPSFIDDLV